MQYDINVESLEMKYGKYWVNIVYDLPQQICISYKEWKTRVKRQPDDTKEKWDTLLMQDCKRADLVFAKRKFPFSFSCSNSAYAMSTDKKIKCCEINSMTLFKVCKKLDKKLGVPAMKWYSDHLAKHEFLFTGSGALTLLRFNNEAVYKECPVCLDNKDTWLVMRCGHCICWSCANTYWKLYNINGTLHNKLAVVTYKNDARCPLCRIGTPWKGMGQIVYSPYRCMLRLL